MPIVRSSAVLLPMGGEAMNGKLRAPPNDPEWSRLLDAERRLEAEIAAAQAEALERVAQARRIAALPVPDARAVAELAAAQEQADRERHRGELAHIAEQADARVHALTQAPDSLIDTLAGLALDAVLSDRLPAQQR
jgi:hypothetical protein